MAPYNKGYDSQSLNLFHINGFEKEFFARDDLGASRTTLWTDQVPVAGLVFLAASIALQLGGHAAKVQNGLLGDGPSGNDLPVKLDRVIHHCRQVADHDMQIGYPFGVRLFGVSHCDVQQRFGYR